MIFFYPFPLIVVVAKLAMDFAAKTRKKRELGVNFDSTDSPRDWIVNTRTGLKVDSSLLL